MMAAAARFPHTASRRSVSVLEVPRRENHTCLLVVSTGPPLLRPSSRAGRPAREDGRSKGGPVDTTSRQVWFSRLGTSSTETLRRLAVWGNLAAAAIIAAAPYISPRPVSERPLYEATAAAARR